MKDGYIKVAAATPKVKVADTVYNGQLIKALMKECTDNGAKEMDQYPENAFFNVGTIEDVIEKAKTEMGQE